MEDLLITTSHLVAKTPLSDTFEVESKQTLNRYHLKTYLKEKASHFEW